MSRTWKTACVCAWFLSLLAIGLGVNRDRRLAEVPTLYEYDVRIMAIDEFNRIESEQLEGQCLGWGGEVAQRGYKPYREFGIGFQWQIFCETPTESYRKSYGKWVEIPRCSAKRDEACYEITTENRAETIVPTE